MSDRPTQLHVGSTLKWTIQTRNPDTMVLKDADSNPTVAVRKNGAATADSVTVTKRSATTGLYDCSYDPAGEIETDQFTLEESATITGTTTASATYVNQFAVRVIAIERGTNGANTTPPDNTGITAIVAALPASGHLAGSADSGGAAELDSAAQAQIDAIEASTAGTVSGAGTGTEIFVGTNVTLTITVDADGNRSSVVVS